MDLPPQLNLVALETFFTPLPELTPPPRHTFSLTKYDRSTASDVAPRIRDAHLVFTVVVPIDAAALSAENSPNLRAIFVSASGVDSIDLDACRRRGIQVFNSPGCNVDAVAEHALALYLAVRRGIVPSMRSLRAGQWPVRGSLMTDVFAAGAEPRGCRDETAVIVGHGAVGRRVGTLLSALGVGVVVAGHKGADVAGEGRVPFDEAIRTATVVFLCCPRTPSTLNLLSTAEFAAMRRDALVVNVSRGGVVDEAALLDALRDGEIAGAGVDVFAEEPAGPGTSPLLGEGGEGVNLVVTPHSAWVGMDTMANYHRVLRENVEGFLSSRYSAPR